MLKEELESRLGYKLEPWQWEMAHYVYQNYPSITHVGGKDKIARYIKEGGGFDSPCAIKQMYRDVDGPPIIVRTDHELLESYDITHEGLYINIRGNKLWDIYKMIKASLKASHKDLMAGCEYFSYMGEDEYSEEKTAVWDIVNHHWTAVHYVRGGSEGYYVHVATVNTENVYKILFLAKTLREGEAGITWAEKMVAVLSRIMEV